MIKLVGEDMSAGEIAALVHDGLDTIIMVNENRHDMAECIAAINQLFAAAGTFILRQT